MTQELLPSAVKVLNDLPHVQAEVSPANRETTPSRSRINTDAMVIIKTPQGQQQYLIEAKSSLSLSAIPTVRSHLSYLAQSAGQHYLLLAHYLSEAVADELVAADIEFLDASGNMYLNSPAAFVLVRGRKGEVQTPSAFTVAGLKVMYALLVAAEARLAWSGTYRELQAMAGVSLGTVSNTIKSLLNEGYLLEGRDKRLLIRDYPRLLRRWELGYIETLRPKLKPTLWGLPRGKTVDDLLPLLENQQAYLVGGEWAAAKLTNLLRPQTLTLHVPEAEKKRVSMLLRLVPAREEVQVEILTRFTQADVYASNSTLGNPLAHPILVRAELLSIGGDRLREVADDILNSIILKGGHSGYSS